MRPVLDERCLYPAVHHHGPCRVHRPITMSDPAIPMTDKEKVDFLLSSFEELRSTLDEAIAFIDDSMIQADERG